MKILLFLGTIFILLNMYIYALDRIIGPTIMAEADATMRATAMEIINNTIVREYSQQSQDNQIIEVEKDESGKIVMLKADTLRMNKIACDIAIESQKQLKNAGSIGIKIPIGYITENNLLSNFGPKITVQMQPIGYIETKYISSFESAGVNQTRHKIYIQVCAKVKIVLPLKNNDIEIKSEVPIAETIIVGETPNTAIQLDLEEAGFKLNTANENKSE